MGIPDPSLVLLCAEPFFQILPPVWRHPCFTATVKQLQQPCQPPLTLLILASGNLSNTHTKFYHCTALVLLSIDDFQINISNQLKNKQHKPTDQDTHCCRIIPLLLILNLTLWHFSPIQSRSVAPCLCVTQTPCPLSCRSEADHLQCACSLGKHLGPPCGIFLIFRHSNLWKTELDTLNI